MSAEVWNWVPGAIAGCLLPELWGVVDDYRDRIWACVAPFRHEADYVPLVHFFGSLEPIVDGVIVVLDPRCRLNNNDLVNESIFVTFKKIVEQSGIKNYLISTIADKDHYSYCDQMNKALSLHGGRSRYLLELQTREIPRCDRVALLTKMDAEKQMDHWVVEARRTILFRYRPDRWACYGSTHSYVAYPPTHKGKQSVLSQNLITYDPEARMKKQFEEDCKSLQHDLANTPTSHAIKQRNEFYLGQTYKTLGHTAAAHTCFENVKRYHFDRKSEWNQEPYVATLELMQTASCCDWIQLALDAVVIDPNRYDALIDLIRKIRYHVFHSMSEQRRFELNAYRLVRDCFVVLHEEDSSKIMVEFAPHRKPRAVDQCLFPMPDTAQAFIYDASALATTISPKFAYAAANTLLLDPSSIPNQHILARRCATLLHTAFPNKPPLPTHIANSLPHI